MWRPQRRHSWSVILSAPTSEWFHRDGLFHRKCFCRTCIHNRSHKTVSESISHSTVGCKLFATNNTKLTITSNPTVPDGLQRLRTGGESTNQTVNSRPAPRQPTCLRLRPDQLDTKAHGASRVVYHPCSQPCQLSHSRSCGSCISPSSGDRLAPPLIDPAIPSWMR